MVGFLKIRGHFCQKLIFRNPDIHRKAQLFINPPAQRIRRQKRISPERLRAAHIHKSFINTILLHTGSVFPENIHKCAGAAAVKPVMRRNHKQIRTFLDAPPSGFPRYGSRRPLRKGIWPGQCRASYWRRRPPHRAVRADPSFRPGASGGIPLPRTGKHYLHPHEK